MSAPILPITLRVDVYSKAEMAAVSADEAVNQLRQDLSELHIDSIEPVRETTPPGSKAGEAFTWGSFLVAFAPELIKQALSVIFDWVRRDPSRVIRLRDKRGGREYEITGAWKAADLAEIMKVLAKQEAKTGNVP